jgi:uncharacterized iron-regulated membrane protein
MTNENSTSFLQTWLRHPQRQPLRRMLFQIHLWTGISLGLYIFFISITGSVLVYRNELYVAATPAPQISNLDIPLLSEQALRQSVLDTYPGYTITRYEDSREDQAAVEIWLENETLLIKRFYDPRTAEDIGSAERRGQMAVLTLIDLHESFMAGQAGRQINGLVALFVVLLVLTGLIIWWPGVKRWRRSLHVRRGVKFKRMIWDIHSMIGIWCAVFILVFAVSGIYLCFPDIFHNLGDRLQPITDDNAGQRFVDRALYWLAFLHFGRINGIGLICDGPGLCDQSVKALWAVVGLAPAAMFVTGASMWWNRVLSRWLRHQKKAS